MTTKPSDVADELDEALYLFEECCVGTSAFERAGKALAAEVRRLHIALTVREQFIETQNGIIGEARLRAKPADKGREPTQEMLQAGADTALKAMAVSGPWTEFVRKVYHAMLAASPPPPADPQRGSGAEGRATVQPAAAPYFPECPKCCKRSVFPVGELCGECRGPPAAAQGWRSIESAPRDGTSVLLRWQGKTVVGHTILDPDNTPMWEYFDEASNGHLPNDAALDDPTHWMPLPPPPAATVTPEGEA